VNDDLGPLARSSKVSLTSVGLTILEDLSLPEWIELMEMLVRLETAFQFAIGDALIWGESTYGEKYSQAMESTGLSYQSLANMVWVAKKVPQHNRVSGLSWTHHRVVASLEPEDQPGMLDYALNNGLSASGLQQMISGKEPTTKEMIARPSGLTPEQASNVLEQYAEAVRLSKSAEPDPECEAHEATGLSSILCGSCPYRSKVV
jgi:lambda repressor-like predicted transcriptional regulator